MSRKIGCCPPIRHRFLTQLVSRKQTWFAGENLRMFDTDVAVKLRKIWWYLSKINQGVLEGRGIDIYQTKQLSSHAQYPTPEPHLIYKLHILLLNHTHVYRYIYICVCVCKNKKIYTYIYIFVHKYVSDYVWGCSTNASEQNKKTHNVIEQTLYPVVIQEAPRRSPINSSPEMQH